MKLNDIIPREHGTWAMWIVPMLSAILITQFSANAALFVICFAIFYLSHRPVVALKKDRHRSDLKKFLAALFAPGIFLAAFLTFARPWLILFWTTEFLLFAFSVKTFVEKEQRDFRNELVILLGLTQTAPAMYYIVTGGFDSNALKLFILNFLFFGSSVFYLKTKIEILRAKSEPTIELARSRAMTTVYHFTMIAIIVLLHFVVTINPLIILGFIPMMAQVGFGIFSKKTKVNFTRIGVTLVAQSVIFLTALKILWN